MRSLESVLTANAGARYDAAGRCMAWVMGLTRNRRVDG
jgi:hypothetical protein